MSTGSASTPCDAQADEVGQATPARRGPTTSTPSTVRARRDHVGRSGGGPSPPRPRDAALPVVPGQGGGGRAEGQQGRDRLEPGPPPPFLLAADEQRLEAAAPPHDQRPAPRARRPSLWALTLTRSAPSAARSIGTCPQAAAASTCTVTPSSRHRATDVVDRLEGADLVVGPLAVHQRGPGWSRSTQPGPERVDVEPAGAVDRDRLGRRRAGRGVADGRVLHAGAQHRRSRAAARAAPQTAALMASVAPEVKTTWRGVSPDELGDVLAGLLERVADHPALLVQAARVRRGQRGPAGERGQRLGARRRRAGVIEVGASHGGAGVRQRRRRCRRRGPATTG